MSASDSLSTMRSMSGAAAGLCVNRSIIVKPLCVVLMTGVSPSQYKNAQINPKVNVRLRLVQPFRKIFLR